MSDWFSDPALLSALFSAIAAAVSALTLWFTRLKGPDIKLVNTLGKRINVIGPGMEKFKEDIAKWLDACMHGIM